MAANSLDWGLLQPGQYYTEGKLAGEVATSGCGIYRLAEGHLELIFNGLTLRFDDTELNDDDLSCNPPT